MRSLVFKLLSECSALIEVGITNLDLLTQVENEKTRKYDLIANEIALMYKCKVKIIPYVMTILYVMISRICEIPQVEMNSVLRLESIHPITSSEEDF